MKLYSSVGPNPKIVRMFLAEKGVEVELVQVDLVGGENRAQDFLKINPMGQLPVLDAGEDGIVTEVTAICEYVEERFPDPPLVGASSAERAETRMWARRLDLNIGEPMANGFRYAEGLDMFQSRVICIPEAADKLKATARKNLLWLESQWNGRNFICGNRFTLADIMLYAALRFFEKQGQPLDPSCSALRDWVARVGARPSARA